MLQKKWGTPVEFLQRLQINFYNNKQKGKDSMKSFFKAVVLMLAVAFSICLSGCGTGFPNGLIYTNVTLPVSASDDPTIQDYNVGKASCTKWFGVIAVGDASVEAAKANGIAGPVSRVQRIEYHALDIMGCGTFTTVVYGEKATK